jgi:hypothetical protein
MITEHVLDILEGIWMLGLVGINLAWNQVAPLIKEII